MQVWQSSTVNGLIRAARQARGSAGGPAVIAVDGRSASGKSTLATLLAVTAGSACVVRTDDIAWNEPPFSWGRLLEEEVMRPLVTGDCVLWKPPAWSEHGRQGRICVRADADLVIIEGAGSLQRQVRPFYHLRIWVQADGVNAAQRGLAHALKARPDQDESLEREAWDHWMDLETMFFAADRPWQGADCVVAGSRVDLSLGPDEVAVAYGPLR